MYLSFILCFLFTTSLQSSPDNVVVTSLSYPRLHLYLGFPFHESSATTSDSPQVSVSGIYKCSCPTCRGTWTRNLRHRNDLSFTPPKKHFVSRNPTSAQVQVVGQGAPSFPSCPSHGVHVTRTTLAGHTKCTTGGVEGGVIKAA